MRNALLPYFLVLLRIKEDFHYKHLTQYIIIVFVNSLRNLTHFMEPKISQRYSQQACTGACWEEPKFILHPHTILLTYVFTLPFQLLSYLSNCIFPSSFKLNSCYMLQPCHHHSLSHPNTLSVTFHLRSFYILRHLVYNKRAVKACRRFVWLTTGSCGRA